MIPSPAEVRQIFNETYNVFYKKWTNPNNEYNPDLMMKEARELDSKYRDYEIINIVKLIVCIEEEWRRRQPSEQ